jgi:hypothetical protein
MLVIPLADGMNLVAKEYVVVTEAARVALPWLTEAGWLLSVAARQPGRARSPSKCPKSLRSDR